MVIELVTKGKRSFLLSTIITLVIVFMLIISGPAQAVRVMLNTDILNNQMVGETGVFYINITIGANEFIPISNISVEGLPDIPGSPGGTLVFKVSDINSIGASIQKGSYNIMLINRYGWVSSFGSGYGYSDNFGYPPFSGYGYGYQFSGYGYGYGHGYGYEGGDAGTGYGYDYGYGYGYGYEGGDTGTYSELKYKVTVDTIGAEAKTYNVAAKLNTGQNVMFIGKSSFTLFPLLSNPGFESGTSPWMFYTNGTGTFDLESPGFEGSNAARLNINSGGTNVQLYQEGITLEPDTRYRLSFAAYSTTGHDMEADLIKHISPYTNYGLIQKIDLSTSWQSFAIEFTTKGFIATVNDGRLMFYLAPFARAGDNYYIDDVRLEKI